MLVVFGGTGDLAHRKIYPAIFNLFVSGQLPKNFALVSVGRREKTNEIFRSEATASIKQFSRENLGTSQDIDYIISRFYYRRVDFSKYEGYQELNEYLETLDQEFETMGNRIFYLVVSPNHFGSIVQHISKSGMTDQEKGYKRVVIEKPFGKDLSSARSLNDTITSVDST